MKLMKFAQGVADRLDKPGANNSNQPPNKKDDPFSDLRGAVAGSINEHLPDLTDAIVEKSSKKKAAIQKLKIAEGISTVAWLGSLIFTAYNAVNLARGTDGKRTHLFYGGAAIVTSYNGFTILNNARQILENATDYLIDPPRDRNWNLKKVVPKLLKDTLFLQHLAKTNNSVAILAAQQLLGKTE